MITVEISRTTVINDKDIQSKRKETLISSDHIENRLNLKWSLVEKKDTKIVLTRQNKVKDKKV